MVNKIVNLNNYYYTKTQIDTLLDAVYGDNSPGTFTDLQTLITNASSGDTIVLDKDYKYDSTTDSSLTNGISISKNIIIIGNGHIIDGNNTKRAFYCTGNYTIELNDLKIQNCYSDSYGGAIYADNNSQVNITHTNINNNTAYRGGAIYTYDNSQINITHTNITQNNATYRGGAIYADYNSQININHTNITQNNAGTWGGAIYALESQITMKESIIKNNTGTNYANIYCGTATTVYNCEINDISTTCYNVTNKDYLTDHQNIPSASISTAGTVQLEDSYSSTSTTKAPTSNALKTGLDTKADSTHTHSEYITSHQDITGKADKTGWTASKNIVTDSSGTLTTEDKPTLSNLGGTVTVEKQTTAESGYAATYVVKQNSTQVGTKINIPKDFLVKSAELKTSTANNSPETGYTSGDKYIDFTINTTDGTEIASHIYLNVKDLVDAYTADETTLTLSNNNQFSIKSVPSHTHNYLTSSDISGKIDTAGTGLSKSGTTLNHSNSITAQTSTALKKIQYDAQGHITGTDSVTASDLPSHTHSYAASTHSHDLSQINNTTIVTLTVTYTDNTTETINLVKYTGS